MQLTVGLIRRAVSGEREAQDELLRIYEPFHDSLLAFAERTKISLFLKELASREVLVAEFDEELWYATVDHVAVYEDKRIPTPEEWLYYAVNYLIEHGDGDLLRWYPNL